MCEFCECKEKIDTTIGNYKLKISLDEENNEIMKVRIETGIDLIRPIKIRYCPFCSRQLA